MKHVLAKAIISDIKAVVARQVVPDESHRLSPLVKISIARGARISIRQVPAV
jgi:hypothetical protein